MLQQRGFFKKLVNSFRESRNKLYPTQTPCIYCHISIKNRKGVLVLGLCEKCTKAIPWIKAVMCTSCGRFETCFDCKRRKNTHFVLNRSAVQYSSEMREWLARYKYRGDEGLLFLLTEMIKFPYESLLRQLPREKKNFDYITFIPLSMERLAERGFNQAEQLAVGLGKAYGIPVVPLLVRELHTGKQSYKTRGQRMIDLEHVFKYDNSSELLQKMSNTPFILLVDDVYTTGSTLNQASAVIRTKIDAQIYCLTWAR